MAQTIFENSDTATYTPDGPNGPKAVTKDPKLNPSPYKKGRVYSIYRHGFKWNDSVCYQGASGHLIAKETSKTTHFQIHVLKMKWNAFIFMECVD